MTKTMRKRPHEDSRRHRSQQQSQQSQSNQQQQQLQQQFHEDDFIPLPIQTFLWRQTSPFVRPYLGKSRDLALIEQRDACKLFERIIITNNVWGQSPSLTDAIASIDRWRLIKVSFPFVLQCTASLLNNKLIKDYNLNRLGGNEAKMMYTLQWILMNASEECADSENEAKVAIASAGAGSLLKPSSASNLMAGVGGTLGAGIAVGQPLTSQGSATSSASNNLDQQHSSMRHQTNGQATQASQQPVASPKSPADPKAHSIMSALNQSIMIPAANTAAGAVAVAIPSTSVKTLQTQTTIPSSSSVSPIGSSTPTKPLTPTSPSSCASNYLLPISSIQMFVYYFAPIMDPLKHSDFLTSNQRLEIGATLWEPLFNHRLPNVQCLAATIKSYDETDARSAFFSPDKSQADTMDDRRRSSSMLHDQSQFGDVFLGGPTHAAPKTKTAEASPKMGPSRGPTLASVSQSSASEAFAVDRATYLDIAVLRCLFMSNWQESGVYWALSFLEKRFDDFEYPTTNLTSTNLRVFSQSVPDIHSMGDQILSTVKNGSKYKRERESKKVEKTTSTDQPLSSLSGFLRVGKMDDDQGSDESKNSARRLSFTSGVQTLANQIRKTSKRSKKAENQQIDDFLAHRQSIVPESGQYFRGRRSSSADYMNANQASVLAKFHKESSDIENRIKDKFQMTESHPIITITTNTNELQPHKESKYTDSKKIDADREEDFQFIVQNLYLRSLRRLDKVTQSQSIPENLHLFSKESPRKHLEESSEMIGAAHYIDDDGRIDPMVILKVVHSISQREDACSLKVCERILSLVTRLINIGILKDNFHLDKLVDKYKDLSSLLPTRRHDMNAFDGPHDPKKGSSSNVVRKQQLSEIAQRIRLIQKILLDVVFNLYYHMGCPNSCGLESTIDHHTQGHPSKAPSISGKASLNLNGSEHSLERSVRSKLRATLNHLYSVDQDEFIKGIQVMINDRTLQQVVDMLHSMLGFCRSDQLTYLSNISARSQAAHHQPSPSNSGNNLSDQQENLQQKYAGLVESVIVNHTFKLLVTRMVGVDKKLKLQENTSLYCDIRRLISFVRDNFSSTFRSLVLGALIDCTRLYATSKGEPNQRRADDVTSPPSDDETHVLSSFKRSKITTEILDTSVQATNGTSSSIALKRDSSVELPVGSYSLDHRASQGSYKLYRPGNQKQERDHMTGSSILSLSRAKKKLEQVFGGKPSGKVKVNQLNLGENVHGLVGSADQSIGSAEVSRRPSIVGNQSVTSFHDPQSKFRTSMSTLTSPTAHFMGISKQNQLLFNALHTGMLNFSFLMESSPPGEFIDPALLAALLDLRSPIAVRAAIFLECAHLVQRCNRGQWPPWMKMNISIHNRGSNVGLSQTSASKHRKSSSIQRTARNNTLMYRAAGKAFYSWAEAVGTRLEELLQNEQVPLPDDAIIEDPTNDDPQSVSEPGTASISQNNDQLFSADTDFFQPTLNGSSSPFALKMAACQLLFEVTTFLRETYRYLPPTIAHHQVSGSKIGDKMASIYDVSRAVTANRRWSMALSSLGFGQLPATLNVLSSHPTNVQPAIQSSTHLRNPASTSIPEHPERRISFVLHETNDEDDRKSEQNSSNQENAQAITSPLASGVNTADQQQDAIRKLTSGRNLSQSSASSAVVVAAATCLLRSSGMIDSQTHRRKSIKLKKSPQDKDQRDKKTKFAQDLDEEMENSSISDVGVRRTDSMRSRRRVSGISEKSDASDRPVNGLQLGPQDARDLSGEDSGGNNSCDEGYGNESLDRFETDQSRIMSNMPWFKAITLINSNIDCDCTHFPTCRSKCYKLHQNMCKKLIFSVQMIYQDSPDSLTTLIESKIASALNQPGRESKMSGWFGRTGSDCSAGVLDSETKRKEKKSRKNQHQPSDLTQDDYFQATPKGKRHHDRPNKGKPSHFDSITGNSAILCEAIKALGIKSGKQLADQSKKDESPILRYVRAGVKNLLHCPMSSFLKGAVILPRESFIDMIKFSWNLLLEDDQQLSRTASVCFIVSSIKCPTEATELLMNELASQDASRRIAAINKFHVVWDARYQCWPRLEDGAFVHFKMAPPSIEFTLPSPKIAQESRPVVDPPWMPRKTSNVEEVTIGQDQTVQRSFVTATKTRRKQQIELVNRALREKHDKLRQGRESYHITSVPITLYAAYEPTLGAQASGDEVDGGGNAGDEDTQQENRALIQMKTAQALFPTCLCQAAIVMINLLDDSRVTYEGSAVYEVASKVVWSCLVEDPSLFLRYFFERLTRQNQNTIFQVLRRLIRFMPRLPPQAAFTLYNYLIGFIIYYIRSPVSGSQKLIADTLSVLCLVVPSVYALFLKDLKQTFRKEQCDHSLLITANVPSAKKIIVHGSDSSGIPSQFPIDESTQFYHILIDSLEFFGIEKQKQNEYFLIDVRTNQMHSLHSYVRDHYSFKRSQHPQLQLVSMSPDKAFYMLQRQELINQFMEFGKVLMTHTIVRSSHMAIGRALFLHEELMKLPTFPRRALETNFSLFKGSTGHQVFSMDRIHKICWVRIIARMFELTSGFFLQLGEIHLFLNAISGVFVLHCEEASVTRLCLATFINAAYQFKNIFAIDGFTPIMATIVQVYSNHQNNHLLCLSIEFVCKQFYIMHRKPFLLQLFGSVASRLNTAELVTYDQSNPMSTCPMGVDGSKLGLSATDPNRISPVAFFRLLQSLDKAFKDPMDILELVDLEKPLRAVDFCYQQDKEVIGMLDIVSLCVTVTAYASESPRSTQMLIILESVVPLYMRHLQACTSKKAGQSMGKQAHKDELQKIQSISICIRTLIVNCEGLTRNFSGPLPYLDFRGSSIRRANQSNKTSSSQVRNTNNSSGSPNDPYNDTQSYTGVDRSKATPSSSGLKQATMSTGASKNSKAPNNEESDISRAEFIVPRDTLLNLTAEFLSLSTVRLVESAKKYVDLHQKHSSYELLDVKSHLRLAEVANSLLKFASTDPSVMACRGLTRYMNEILPNTEWRQEAIRPALIMILKRLDKTFNRISKKSSIKRNTDWGGAKQLLKGAYLTFIKHPYIVHLPHLKSLISCCQNIILSDSLQSQITTNFLQGLSSNQVSQQTTSVSQSTSMNMQSTDRAAGNFLRVTNRVPGSPLTPSGSGSQNTMGGQTQKASSFVNTVAAAALAERLAANATFNNSVTSQAFNSVTVRLIAMQLLQSGENQTLENLVGNSMNTPEKLESLMLNLIYPMCIRVCSGSREAPKLRPCDITFILNIVLTMLAPQSPSSRSHSSSVSSPKVAADTSQFILSKITTTIGSTQTGATALGIVGSSAHSAVNMHQVAQHQENLKIGLLGLKILCVCFESHLASEWIRIARVLRDLTLQTGQPSGPLWDFLDYLATFRFPLLVLLLPMIKCHLAKRIREARSSESNSAPYNIQCYKLIDAKIRGSATTICRSKSFLFVSLTAELRMLKEQLIAKRRMLLEGERLATSQSNQHSQSHGTGSSYGQNVGGPSSDGPSQDHFSTYHRLSAAIAMFANQGMQSKMTSSGSGSGGQQLGATAALKNAYFAAQLAAPSASSQIEPSTSQAASCKPDPSSEPSQNTLRLSAAKSREEARMVMNTILRRTSYPHNQSLGATKHHKISEEKKGLQTASPSSSKIDVEAGNSSQIIMDPAMLMMSAFPPPRKTTNESPSILKQLIQTIDRQNQKQSTYQTTALSEIPSAVGPSEALIRARGDFKAASQSESKLISSSISQGSIGDSHRHPKMDEKGGMEQFDR